MDPSRLKFVSISNGEIVERGSFMGLGGGRSPRTYLTDNMVVSRRISRESRFHLASFSECAWVTPMLHALLFDEWRDSRRNNIETHLSVFFNAFF